MNDHETDHFFRRPLQAGRLLRDRDSALVELCRGRRVAHIGCVDWPLSQERLRDGLLLHPKLLAVSSEIVGIDVDAPGLDDMRSTLGGSYLALDVTASGSDARTAVIEALGDEPDIVIAGDVIEHVPDPVGFVRGLADLVTTSDARVVITTPNSLAVRSSVNTLLGYELMHPDHISIHTPTTLRTVVERGGLRVVSWNYYSITTGSDLAHRGYDIVSRVSARVRPAWADGHLVVAQRG